MFNEAMPNLLGKLSWVKFQTLGRLFEPRLGHSWGITTLGHAAHSGGTTWQPDPDPDPTLNNVTWCLRRSDCGETDECRGDEPFFSPQLTVVRDELEARRLARRSDCWLRGWFMYPIQQKQILKATCRMVIDGSGNDKLSQSGI
ncbi:hypothetical protein Tco_1543762 [Tanacetum coccineum]